MKSQVSRPSRNTRIAKASAYGADAPRCVRLTWDAGRITAGVTAQFGSFEFQLDQFSGFADYAAVFDSYRLKKIRATFIPNVNTHSLTGMVAGTLRVAPIVTVIDYDDSNIPSSIDELLQFSTSKVQQPFQPFALEFKPRPATALYAGGVTPGYAQASPNTWIDCANDDVSHYGMKWGSIATGASQTVFQEWKVFFEGWFEFRQPR